MERMSSLELFDVVYSDELQLFSEIFRDLRVEISVQVNTLLSCVCVISVCVTVNLQIDALWVLEVYLLK